MPEIERQTITVKTRKEFIDLFRNMFIPNCNRIFGKGGAEDFNIGHALNHWTSFWVWNENDVFVTVDLVP